MVINICISTSTVKLACSDLDILLLIALSVQRARQLLSKTLFLHDFQKVTIVATTINASRQENVDVGAKDEGAHSHPRYPRARAERHTSWLTFWRLTAMHIRKSFRNVLRRASPRALVYC